MEEYGSFRQGNGNLVKDLGYPEKLAPPRFSKRLKDKRFGEKKTNVSYLQRDAKITRLDDLKTGRYFINVRQCSGNFQLPRARGGKRTLNHEDVDCKSRYLVETSVPARC